MRTVLSYPGNMLHAQHVARALAEARWLSAFVTTFAYRGDGALSGFVKALPAALGRKLDRELSRRSVGEVPSALVHDYPAWEILRTLAQRGGASAPMVDRIWDAGSHRFDAHVARRFVPGAEAVHAFEYTALASFRRAREAGTARVLHLPSLDNRQYAEIEQRERAAWKELASRDDAYFARKFPARQARRSAEIELADVIVCNSSLTARSHIAAGADAGRVVVVPLGAPAPIPEPVGGSSPDQPLRVVSAGPFSLRKGGHYLLDGWRRSGAATHARLDVFGRVDLPERALSGDLTGVTFHGSVPQAELFAAFERSDVLVFPTLSDGFGLVVTEALSRGLPVITTDQAGAADLITDENGLIIPAADPGAIADALRWCLDNRKRLQAMRRPALEAARGRQWSHFRQDLMAALTVRLAAPRQAAEAHPPTPAIPTILERSR
jgi:glycosyltransferase involved in cell wall biosynthesis